MQDAGEAFAPLPCINFSMPENLVFVRKFLSENTKSATDISVFGKICWRNWNFKHSQYPLSEIFSCLIFVEKLQLPAPTFLTHYGANYDADINVIIVSDKPTS